MPIVAIQCFSVNPKEYTDIVKRLHPCDVPCIYCGHLFTYVLGYYCRRPIGLGGLRYDFRQQRRECPICDRTFALLPSFVAPFQRYTIVVQDLLVGLFSGTLTLEDTLLKLAEAGVCLGESSARNWFFRIQKQVAEILALFSRMVQSERPDIPLPPLRVGVRDVRVCAYYDRLMLLEGPKNSGAWNLTRRIACLFSPSVSVNRVSYGLSPAFPP